MTTVKIIRNKASYWTVRTTGADGALTARRCYAPGMYGDALAYARSEAQTAGLEYISDCGARRYVGQM
jgi:hypothetical protein